MKGRYNKNTVAQIAGKSVFFDANILLYLFWHTGANKWERHYASIFGLLLKQQNQLVVDFMVVSEVINRAMRIEYEKYKISTGLNCKYKTYRNSTDGENALKAIYIIIKNNVLNYFLVDGKINTKSDIESYLTVDHLDFNDKSIVSLCLEKGYILFTNDGDYSACDVDILSANSILTTKT